MSDHLKLMNKTIKFIIELNQVLLEIDLYNRNKPAILENMFHYFTHEPILLDAICFYKLVLSLIFGVKTHEFLGNSKI